MWSTTAPSSTMGEATAPLVRVETNMLPRSKLLVVFGGLALSLFVSFVDQNSISVALPVLGRDLDAASTISWAGTSSLIANTVCQVLYGRLSDIVGRKPVLLFCIGLLALGDMLCAFARTGPQLYAARGIAGIGNGGIAALCMIIVSDVGILGACVGLGNVVGPFLAAGVIRSWRWQGVFWIICALACSCGVVVLLVIPPSQVSGSRREKLRAIDWLGLATSAAGLMMLLVPITSGGADLPWGSPVVISLLAAGSALVAAFVVVEWRWASMPLLPLKFFAMPQVATIMSQNLLMGAVYYSNLYFLPVYFQSARRWSLMDAAVLTIPLVAGQSVVSVLSGRYISHFGRYGEVVRAGYAVWTLGSGLTLLFGRGTPRAVIVAVCLVEGAGIGLVFQPTLVAIQACTAKEDRAVATSVWSFTRAVGGALGLAVSTAVMSHVVAGEIVSLPRDVQERILGQVLSVQETSGLSPDETDTILRAYTVGCRSVFTMWVALMATCLALCVFIRDRGLSRPDEPVEALQEADQVLLPHFDNAVLKTVYANAGIRLRHHLLKRSPKVVAAISLTGLGSVVVVVVVVVIVRLVRLGFRRVISLCLGLIVIVIPLGRLPVSVEHGRVWAATTSCADDDVGSTLLVQAGHDQRRTAATMRELAMALPLLLAQGLADPKGEFCQRCRRLAHRNDRLTRLCVLPNLEQGADDDADILGTEGSTPPPASDEAPSVLGTGTVLAVCIHRGYHFVQVVQGPVLEKLGSQLPLQHHVHVGVALLALSQADTHLGQQLVQTPDTGLAPRLEAREEVWGVKHAVIETPVPDKEESRFGREADTGVLGVSCRSRDDARILWSDTSVCNLQGVKAPHFVS
ncbi:transporter [Geosmithia morbida]|uniref:Transporter n=1 Tax=Geosmithia morbida TaxID=1094350 RepID=A0A9P4Z3K3_9HYPO|nr:transporter [Geosmithia morbida]KAF4126881.1 transporter [Geosmithia morbida]